MISYITQSISLIDLGISNKSNLKGNFGLCNIDIINQVRLNIENVEYNLNHDPKLSNL